MNQAESTQARLPESILPARRWAGPARVQAVAQVVIKELYRRKDFYVLFILTALITLALGLANFFGETAVVRYVKEICLLLIWICSIVISVTMAARQIPVERENRTLFPLLAKPLTRQELMLGKFFGCWWAAGISLLVFYLFLFVNSGAREHAWPVTAYLQALSLHWMVLAVIIAMTLLGSIVFAAPSSNSTIIFVLVTGILLVGRYLNRVALQLDEPAQSLLTAVYFTIPHLEIFDVRNLLIHSWGTIPWLAWSGAVLYGSIYSSLFLAAACWIFGRKSLT